MNHGRSKLLPPGNGHLAIPVSSRDAARAGLAMYTACKPRALWLQRLAWSYVGVLGPWALPVRAETRRPPVDEAAWLELKQRWTAELGAFDDLAVHYRRPIGRSGASLLLLRDGEPMAFVKVRDDRGHVLEREGSVLDALADHAPAAFTAPRRLAHGIVGSWHYLAMSTLPPRIHTVVSAPAIREITQEIGEALHDRLPREANVPAHWQPMHGDFTPWNLRSLGETRPVLFDWEDARWAPPGADPLWYDVVLHVVGLAIEPSGMPADDEAARYWMDRLVERDDTPKSLHGKALTLLRSGWRP